MVINGIEFELNRVQVEGKASSIHGDRFYKLS